MADGQQVNASVSLLVKPCPFCGAMWGAGVTLGYKGRPATSWHIDCTVCKFSGPDSGHMTSPQAAVDKWNLRVAVPECGTPFDGEVPTVADIEEYRRENIIQRGLIPLANWAEKENRILNYLCYRACTPLSARRTMPSKRAQGCLYKCKSESANPAWPCGEECADLAAVPSTRPLRVVAAFVAPDNAQWQGSTVNVTEDGRWWRSDDDPSPFGLVQRLRAEAKHRQGTRLKSNPAYFLYDLLREAARVVELEVVAAPRSELGKPSEPVAWAVVHADGDPREANSIHWPATCRHSPDNGDAKASAQRWADRFGYRIVPLYERNSTDD